MTGYYLSLFHYTSVTIQTQNTWELHTKNQLAFFCLRNEAGIDECKMVLQTSIFCFGIEKEYILTNGSLGTLTARGASLIYSSIVIRKDCGG